ALVQRAFASVPYNLNRLELFHTDRGSEFNNQLIDDALQTFGIERSLSEKGNPYDNAVAEAMFKTIKTEFVNGTVFPCQQALALVQRAFASVPYNLNRLELFHTDRGSEFNNQLIDDALQTFGIERSLSEKGNPYDNAVAEAMFKTIKTEFVNGTVFPCQQALD